MNLTQLEVKTDSLIEKVRALNYRFKDADLETDASSAKEEIIALLENYFDLATNDSEQHSDEIEIDKNSNLE